MQVEILVVVAKWCQQHSVACIDSPHTHITPAELRFILHNLGEDLEPKEVDDIISDAPTDENGRINYRTFAAMMLSEAT